MYRFQRAVPESCLLVVDDASALRLCFKADEWPIQTHFAIDWKCYSVVVWSKPQLFHFQRFKQVVRTSQVSLPDALMLDALNFES